MNLDEIIVQSNGYHSESSNSTTFSSESESNDFITLSSQSNDSINSSEIAPPAAKRFKPNEELSNRIDLVSVKFCNGYKPKFNSNISLNFPIQRIAMEYDRQWRINVEKSSFHHVKCYKNNCLINVDDNNETCNHCEQLQFNMDLKALIERSRNDPPSNTIYKFLSFNQLVNRLDNKSNQINELKLNSLNLLRNNLNLINRTSDYKRLMILISANDIPRIKQLISACLKSNISISMMTERIAKAINGVYRPKQFDEKDIDLGTLVLRIGGTGLLNTFYKLGKIFNTQS